MHSPTGLLLARERPPWPMARMNAPGPKAAPAKPLTEDGWMGRALRNLREARGLTQPQAAAAFPTDKPGGISVQAWQNYEAGKRRFTPTLVRDVTTALGAAPEELSFERAKLPATNEPDGFGGGVGEGQTPLVGIVTKEGALLVKRFHHILDGKLFAQDVATGELTEFALDQLGGVHALSLRGR